MPTQKVNLKAGEWVDFAVPEDYNRITLVVSTGNVQIKDARSNFSDIENRKGTFKFNEPQSRGVIQIYSTVTETAKIFYGLNEEYVPEPAGAFTMTGGRFIAHNAIENMLQTGLVTEANLRAQDNATGDSWAVSSIDTALTNPSLSRLLGVAAFGFKRVSGGMFHKEYMPDQFADIPNTNILVPTVGTRIRILWIEYTGANANCLLTGSVAGAIAGTLATVSAGVLNIHRDFGGRGILLDVDETIQAACPGGSCSIGFAEE